MFAAERASTAALCNDIIARVRNKPELWCSSHPRFMNRMTQKNFWAETSAELGIDENSLKKRWKHLKDQYRKEAKKVKEKGFSDQQVVWQYYEAMWFLKDEVLKEKPKPPADNESDEEEEADPAGKVRVVEARTDESKKLHMIYKGLMETKAVVEERMKVLDDVVRHDPDYMYLMSLQPTLKQLTDIQKLQLKGKINEWLLEAVAANEYDKDCDTKYIVSDVLSDEEK